MSNTELRWQLRQLPREIAASRDLWPGIAARIDAAARRSRRRRGWLAGASLATAASLLLALALPERGFDPGPIKPDAQTQMVQREAQAMTAEYRAALQPWQGAPMPAEIEPALRSLDQSAAQLRSAIAADPDAVFLLDRLHRTYARRLSLTQQALAG